MYTVLSLCAKYVGVVWVEFVSVVMVTVYNEKSTILPTLLMCLFLLSQAFAWLGFAVSIVWIYSIANEIVNLLQVFGIVMKLSDGILGLTLLAWGNSIGGESTSQSICTHTGTQTHAHKRTHTHTLTVHRSTTLYGTNN